MFFFLKKIKKKIYFDNSSTNQKPDILFKSIINILQKKNFNLNRGNNNLNIENFFFFKKIKKILNLLINNIFIEEIIFFFNSTFSINFLLLNLLNIIKKNYQILISNKEHNSILISLIKILKFKKNKIIVFPSIKNKNYLNIFCNFINSNTFVFIINHISNNFGYINKIKYFFKICLFNNIITILDCTQSITYLKINIKKTNIIFLFFSFHKIYSLTGSSLLFCNMFMLKKINMLFTGGGNVNFNNYIIKHKKYDEKFYFGTQNFISIFSSYYSIKWFLTNKKFIFYKNLYFKKIIFCIFNKKKKTFSNILLINSKNVFFLNNILNLNKIIIRCDYLCNFMKIMFINKKNNCRISFNFFNKIKEILKIKFLIFFYNFRIKNC
ncbi:MAG: aminotransferase class V-fold PLP-dependent enzyme [Candidatus Carsonella ruddii]